MRIYSNWGKERDISKNNLLLLKSAASMKFSLKYNHALKGPIYFALFEKKLLLKILQYPQKNICVGVYF